MLPDFDLRRLRARDERIIQFWKAREVEWRRISDPHRSVLEPGGVESGRGLLGDRWKETLDFSFYVALRPIKKRHHLIQTEPAPDPDPALVQLDVELLNQINEWQYRNKPDHGILVTFLRFAHKIKWAVSGWEANDREAKCMLFGPRPGLRPLDLDEWRTLYTNYLDKSRFFIDYAPSIGPLLAEDSDPHKGVRDLSWTLERIAVALRDLPPESAVPVAPSVNRDEPAERPAPASPSVASSETSRPRASKPRLFKRGELDDHATTALALNPKWTNQQIADHLGCNVKSLSTPRLERFQKARKLLAESRDRFHHHEDM